MGLAEACLQLEDAINRIPTKLGAVTRNLIPGGDRQESNGDVTPGIQFGRSIDDIFNHSWWAEGGLVWIWVPKPVFLGEKGFPTRAEEIKRLGWKARRLVRVAQPPPLTRSFASVAQIGAMARDNRRYNWEAEMGGGEKRRFEDERDGNRSYQDQNSGGWREEERRRELQLRERMQRDRDGYQPGGSRQFREEEDAGKRRAMDGRRSDFDSGERNFNFNQGNQIPRVRDRLGGVRNQGGHGEEGNRGKSTSQENKGGAQAGICFWCRQEGHHQADCTNTPFCFRCKESGHIAARCPMTKEASMHMYGFGFPRQGFHCLKIPGMAKQQVSEHQGLITVGKGGMSEGKMEEELKHLIDEKWQWKVKKISDKESWWCSQTNSYLRFFPSPQGLLWHYTTPGQLSHHHRGTRLLHPLFKRGGSVYQMYQTEVEVWKWLH